jgi:hypothetical protein
MIAARLSTDEMFELIRPLLARFSENEETVRQLMATDASFDALCEEYGEVVERLENFEVEVKEIKERKARLEEDLLMHMEGYEPH